MNIPVEDVLNPHIATGIFALYVVAVSLVRVMRDKEFFRLTAMKKIWGRTRGLTLHFVSNVALPLICGIVFLTRGFAGLPAVEPGEEHTSTSWTLMPQVIIVVHDTPRQVVEQGQGQARSRDVRPAGIAELP